MDQMSLTHMKDFNKEELDRIKNDGARKGVIYSTAVGYVDKEAIQKSLMEISSRYIIKEKDKLLESYRTAVSELTGNSGNIETNGLTLIHVKDFVECWLDPLKKLMREGIDTFADGRRSIYSVWSEQTGSPLRPFLICESGNANGKYCIKPIYKTPTLAILQEFNEEYSELDLTTMAGTLNTYMSSGRMEEYSHLAETVVNRIANIEYKKNTPKQVDEFKEAWEKLFNYLDEYRFNVLGHRVPELDDWNREDKSTNQQETVKSVESEIMSEADDIYDF